MAKSLVIKIVGDADSYIRSLNEAETKTKGFGVSLKSLAKVGAAGAAAAGVALVTDQLGKSIEAAREAQKAQIRLEQALKSAGVSYKAHGKAIDEAIQKTSKLAALDDEDLSDAFAKLVRSTGNVKDAMEGMNLAADIARGRNISLEAATKAVEKAFLGSDTALKRIGVTVPRVTNAQDALKQQMDALKDKIKEATGSTKEHLEAQLKQLEASKKAAAAIDKQATAQDAIAKAQKLYAGAAEEYGKSSAGAHERFQVAVENLQEAIGAKLLPVIDKFYALMTKVILWLTDNGPTIGKIFETVATVVENAFKPLWNYIENTAKIVGDLVTGIKAIINGDWSQAWASFSDIPSKALKIIWDTFLAAPRQIAELALALGKAAAEKIGEGLAALPGVIASGLEKLGGALASLPAAAVSAATALGGKILEAIGNGLSGTISGLGDLGGKIASLLGGIGAAGSAVFNAAKDVGGRVLSAIGAGLEGTIGGLAGIGGKISEILGGIGAAGSAVFNAAKAVGARLMDAIKDAIGVYVGIGNAIWGRISDGVTAIADDVRGAGGKIAGWVKEGISAAVGFGTAVYGAVKKGIDNVAEDVKALGKKLAGWIKEGISSVGDLLSGAFRTAVNTAIGLLNAAIKAYNAIPLAPNIPTIPTLPTGSTANVNPATNPNAAGPPAPTRTTQAVSAPVMVGPNGQVSVPVTSAPAAPAPPPSVPVVTGTNAAGDPLRLKGIPEYADGGVFMRPSLGIIGEKRPEAVLPLDRLNGMIGGGWRGGKLELHVHGNVITERDLVQFLWQKLLDLQRSGAGLSLTGR